MDSRIAVIDSGDNTGLNFCRSLRLSDLDFDLIGIEPDRHSAVLSEADEARVLAQSSGPGFIEELASLDAQYNFDLIYAADTGPRLDALSAARDQFPNRVFLPDLDDHIAAEDKWETYLRLRGRVPVPATMLLEKPADVGGLLRRFPQAWIRRRKGSGGAGALRVSDPDLAAAWIGADAGWGQYIGAELLSKRTSTLSGLWFDGELVASQLRERVAWGYSSLSPSGVTGITSAQFTVDDAQLHAAAVEAVRATCARPHGIMGADFTYSDAGDPLVTEVQPARFYSSIEFLARCGLNLPEMYVRLALGGRDAVKGELINPIDSDQYWVKAVDCAPRLMSADEYWGA